MRTAIILAAVLLFANLSYAQTTWIIPDDFPRGIQSAISDPSVISGDTLLVRPGTYFENISFLAKGINLVSMQGPEVTVIDGNMTGSVVTFMNGKEQSAVLDGFTITNGSGVERDGKHYGGGIFCYETSCLIQNNIITENINTPPMSDYHCSGNGIYCSNSNTVIANNVISHNHCALEDGSCFGGGIYSYLGYVDIISNLITENSCVIPSGSCSGGGLRTYGAKVNIINNMISFNTCEGDYGKGGGIYGSSGTFISGNFITDNSVLSNNYAYGGGVYGYSSTLINNVIARNTITAEEKANGGGIYCYDFNNNSYLTNNTVYGNQVTGATTSGAGIHSSVSMITETIVKNTIIWANIGADDISEGGDLTFCAVQNGDPGPNNINDDPLFVDPANNDFHLTWTSPCINRGTNEDIPDVDQDLNDRVFMGTVDMGAYEFSQQHSLTADVPMDIFELSQSQGGSIDFTLDAQFDNSNRVYLMIGGFSGTIPGTPLPTGSLKIPVNWDGFTNKVITLLNTSFFLNFFGALDGAGRASATLNANEAPLPLSFLGKKLNFAYTLDAPWDFVSNPVVIEVVP